MAVVLSGGWHPLVRAMRLSWGTLTMTANPAVTTQVTSTSPRYASEQWRTHLKEIEGIELAE